ncbi:MAG TPA: RHS repeat-associated core domain-containing protein, partial [Vicinamibacterales bacterium]|nr:RHS repeat-associated core domain-containing protein [Vicinamibacterales bacterium]
YGASGTGVFTKLANVTKSVTQTAEGLVRSRTVQFGQQNLPVVVQEPDGWTLTIQRDDRGNAQWISEATGTSTFDYDEHGLLRSSTTPYEGNSIYVYEEDDPHKKGYIKSVTTPAGTTQIDVDDHGNVLSITPPGGAPETFAVNDLDQVEVENAGDSSTTLNYDAAGNVSSKNALAGTAPDGTPVYANVNYETDELGRLTSVNDSGSLSTFGYDSAGNMTSVATPSGAPATLTYDERGLLESITRGGRTSSYGYNDAGSLTSVKSPSGKVTNITVNGFGEPVGMTDSTGIQTATRLDTGGHPIDTRQIKPATNGDKLLLNWTQREYDSSGRVTKETRKLFNGTLTIPVTGDDPSGATDLVTTMTHDDAAHKETLTDPRGKQTVTEYDAMGRKARVTDAAGNRLELTYDGKSNVSEARLVAVRQDGTTETFSTKYQYDAKNRITAIIDAGDPLKPLIASYRYDVRGNRTEETDYEGHTRRFEYDLRGNKAKQIDPQGGVTEYKYDDANRPLSVKDANGNETTYTYDAEGHLVTEKRTDGATWTYTYDDDGNRATVTDPNGTVTTNTYDDANRLLSQSIAKGPGVLGPSRITYTRDDLGRVVTTETDEGVKTFITYDSLDRAIDEEIQAGSGPRRKVARQYDPAGNLTAITYPSGLALTQAIDPLGRITAVTEAGGSSPIVSYGDSGGRQVSKTLANGISETWSYDPNRRISGIQDRLGADLVRDLAYARTPLGNKSSLVRNDLAKQWTYLYNRNSWMTNESVLKTGTDTNPLLESTDYDVDPVLNYRSIKHLAQSDAQSTTTTTAFSVNSRNQYTSAGSESPVYDRNGNVVQLHGAVLQYDYENRLRKATLPYGAVVEYLYDASGRKTEAKLTSGGGTRVTDYVTNDQQVLEEYVGGALSARYTRGRGVDEIVRAEGSTRLDGTVDRVLFPLQDENGNVDRITDSSGSTLERYEYSGYGKFHIFAPDSSTRSSSAYDWRWLFQGREHDATLGAYDFRARTLWPDLGRFGQEDPARSHRELSLYEAMMGSPANVTDPSGMYEEDVHHYLSWFLAENGGFSHATASQIGYESGKLDINDSRDAMHGGVSPENMRDFHFVSEKRLNELKQIANGGNALNQPTLTRIGEFIHALEDSYSHQSDQHRRDFSKRFNDLVPGKLKWLRDFVPGGKGHGIGHGVEGHTPDQTWRRPDLAMLMAEDVYREMVNLCLRYSGTACATHSFEGLRPRVKKFIEFEPDRYVQWKFAAYPVEDVIDYTDKIRMLDPTYSINHDEWAIRHGEYVKSLSQDVRKWTGHKIYRDPHVIKGVVTNPDPDSVSGCRCWIGLGE